MDNRLEPLQKLQLEHSRLKYYRDKGIDTSLFGTKYLLTEKQGYDILAEFIRRYKECNPFARADLYTTFNQKEINYLLLVAGRRGYEASMEFIRNTDCSLETVVWFIAKFGNIQPRY